ncbi:MAG: Gfo/Idh/MocA family protein [Armatimonadota bacterium]
MAALQVGVIGVGTWGETHLKTYGAHPECDIRCLCDVNEELARERAGEYGVGAWTTDYEELLGDEAIQAVSIATPDFAHGDIAVAAANAGKHILIEKPLATTVADCERIIAAAQANGVKLMVDFHNRFNPPLVKTKRSLEEGELGDLQMMSVRLNDTLFVPTQMLSWAGKSTVTWFLASHCVDLVRFLSGDEVRRVYSVSRSRVLEPLGIPTPDFYQTILELEGGATAYVENCWIISESFPNVFDFKLEVVGAKGTVFADLSTHGMLSRYTEEEAGYPDVAVFPEVHGKLLGFAVEAIRHWIDCLLEDKEPLVGGGDGLAATKVVLAIHQSAEKGEPVEVG